MAIRLAGRQGDLDALINVWIKTIEQDPTTDFRYLANRKDIEAGPFAKEARSKCAKYLLGNLVAVYEVDGKIVAMACWSFVHPTMPAGSFAMCKMQPSPDAEPPTPKKKFIHAFREAAWKEQSAQAKKVMFDRRYPDGYLYLKVLYVLPEFQRRGIGRSLTRWGMGIARRVGLPIALFASHNGQKLYGSLGFQVVGDLRVQAGGDGDDDGEKVLEVTAMVLPVENNKVRKLPGETETRLYAIAVPVLLWMLR